MYLTYERIHNSKFNLYKCATLELLNLEDKNLADLIVEGRYIVTMDNSRRIIEHGAVVIDNHRIIDIGKASSMKKIHTAERTISGKKFLVLPGLIDSHTHIFQSLLRGLGDNMPVNEWGEKSVSPMAKLMTRDEFYWAAKLNALEMIKSGTTAFADSHFVHFDKQAMDGIADGTLESGLSAKLVRSTQSSFRGYTEDISMAKRETKRLYDKYNGQGAGRITIAPEVVSPLRAEDEFILAIKELADDLGNGMCMHIAETLDRYKEMKSRSGFGEIGYLEKLGVLDSSLLMAHCIWVPPNEIVSIQKAGAKVAHNAISNSFLADGIANVPFMRALGITVAIGCDGASSNNDQDMIKAMKICALMHKVNTLNASILTAEDVLEMITVDGAKALLMEAQIGSIEIGKRADLTVVDLEKPHLTPCPRPISNLVYSANGSDVVFTIVDGQILMDNRIVTTLNESEILQKAEEITSDLIVKSDLGDLVRLGNFQLS